MIFQKVRDAERERQYEEFKDRMGEIITGVVKRVEFGHVVVDLGRAEGVIRRDAQIPREVVRVNDRGPFLNDRVIDLSYVAAYKLGMLGPGSAEVVVERITAEQIKNWQSAPATLEIATANSTPAATFSGSQPAADNKPTVSQTSPAKDTQTTAPMAVAAIAEATPAAAATGASAPLPPSGDLPARPALPGSMYLQLGAFSDASKAQALATRVSNQIPPGLGASVRVEQTFNKLHRVRIGPFESREAAVQAVDPVQTSTGMAPSLSPP